MKYITIVAIAVTSSFFASSASADLIFKFTNPSFGGNPNNGSYLFGLAEAQAGATRNDIDADGTAGAGGGIGTGVNGPTIIIPINPGDAIAPAVDATGDTSQARIRQIGE